MLSTLPTTRFASSTRSKYQAAPRLRAQSNVGWIEYFSMMFVVSIYAGATPRFFIGAGTVKLGETELTSTIAQTFALIVVMVWALASSRRIVEICKAASLYLIIMVLCFASVRWSLYPVNTIRRSAAITICLFYGLYIYDRLGLEGTIRLVTYTMVALGLASIVAYFVKPSAGRDAALGYTKAMRGVFASKNTAGMAMLLTVACIMYLGSLPGAKRWRWLAALAFTFLSLVMTMSATSTLIALIVMFFGFRLWLRSPTLLFLHKIALIGGLVLLAFTLVCWPQLMFAALGRDSSLTGRVPLWQECWVLIQQRPFLGYGYSGFWIGDSHQVQYLWEVIGWNAPNAHNGYIDIVLQLGFVGLFFYMLMWGSIVVRAAKHTIHGTLQEAPWMLLFMTVNALLNIDEGPLPYPDEFTLFVGISLVALARAAQHMPQVARKTLSPAYALQARRDRQLALAASQSTDEVNGMVEPPVSTDIPVAIRFTARNRRNVYRGWRNAT